MVMARFVLLAAGAGVVLALASAADAKPRKKMVTKAPPKPAVQAAIRPSIYAGVHAGGGWSRFSGGPFGQSVSGGGVLGGGQVGFNYQFERVVLGMEADASAASVKGDAAGALPVVSAGARNRWFATLAVRIGMAEGLSLFYLKAGAAWTGYAWDTTIAGIGAATTGGTRSGWIVGAGVERALGGALSAKVEYNYLDFGSVAATAGALAVAPFNVGLDAHLVKFGLNYRLTP
jgi:outer membrane immunogenic protein